MSGKHWNNVQKVDPHPNVAQSAQKDQQECRAVLDG
jgi:hypothetical protein